MSTTLNIDVRVLDILESKIKARQYEQVLSGIYQILWDSFWDESYKGRYNHLPELDSLIQCVGEALLDELHLSPPPNKGRVNVFVASELYRWGGHTRVLEDLTRHSDKNNLVILTDLFDGYASGRLELGPVVSQLNASICVLPKMSLVDKTKSLMGILRAIDINTIGIFAHHQDVIAYAACNDRLGYRQVYVHHADHHPTLGATVAHYEHLDLFPGNLQLCADAGYVTPKYMPATATQRFQTAPRSGDFNTGTSGTFNKFATEGELNYADIVVGILLSSRGKHVHVGDIPQPYLEVIQKNLVNAGLDPSRFVHVGTVASLQDALIDQGVSIYITSAPVGGGKAYVEAVGLGIGVLLYWPDRPDDREIFHYAEANYGKSHLRWSGVEQLSANLEKLDIQAEYEKSRAIFSKLFSPAKFAEIVDEYF